VSSTESQPDALAPGTLIAGRDRVVDKLGEGGMGAVYRATQEPLGREVALKVIAAGLAVDKGAVERFQREARASSSLSHPNIVTVYDYGKDDVNGLFIAMELIQGAPGDKLVEKGPLPWRRAVAVLRGVCAALAEAHAKGIVHRDLKPANVLVTSTTTQQDIAKVVDFGIAKMRDGGATLTMTGAVVGTPGYVAPELFDGHEPSPQTDLYALGVVAFELLCGRAPFPGKTPMELIKAHILTAPASPSLYASELPPALDALVLSLLAKDPATRPQSAADVDLALQSLQLLTPAPASSSEPASSPPPPSPATQPMYGGSGKVVVGDGIDVGAAATIQGLTPAQPTELATPLPPPSLAPPSSSTAPSSPSKRPGSRRWAWVLVPIAVIALSTLSHLCDDEGGRGGDGHRGPHISVIGDQDDDEDVRRLAALGRRIADVAADGGVLGVVVDGDGDVRVSDPDGHGIYDALSLHLDAGPAPALEPIDELLGKPKKKKKKVTVSEGAPVVVGSLDREVIVRVVRSHRAEVRRCAEPRSARAPDAQGKLTLKVTINGEGDVSAAAAAESTLQRPDVEQCLLQAARGWKFPKPKGHGIVIFTFPFTFRTEG
jgi:serine/threonine-protein kinase